MSQTTLATEAIASYPMNIRVSWLTDDLFARLCRDNPELRLELTAQGELIIMPPTGSETGRRGNGVSFSLTAWAKRDGTGLVFDSSTGFTLPNGAKRSPDASWVRRARWGALTKEQRQAFAPLCPDFVVELRSPTDSLAVLRAKTAEYIANGAQLGWLIDPVERRVYIYRPGQPVEVLYNPTILSGDPVLQDSF